MPGGSSDLEAARPIHWRRSFTTPPSPGPPQAGCEPWSRPGRCAPRLPLRRTLAAPLAAGLRTRSRSGKALLAGSRHPSRCRHPAPCQLSGPWSAGYPMPRPGSAFAPVALPGRAFSERPIAARRRGPCRVTPPARAFSASGPRERNCPSSLRQRAVVGVPCCWRDVVAEKSHAPRPACETGFWRRAAVSASRVVCQRQQLPAGAIARPVPLCLLAPSVGTEELAEGQTGKNRADGLPGRRRDADGRTSLHDASVRLQPPLPPGGAARDRAVRWAAL